GYRAMVRAKVAAMAAAEPELGPIAQSKARAKAEARARLALVELSPPRRRPCLVMVAGLPGSGKSVLARGLRETAGFVWIRADEIRKRLAGIDPLANGNVEVEGGIYTPEWNDRTYEACLQRAGDICQRGGRALVDATFIDGERRKDFVEAAVRWGVPAHFLEVHAPAELVRERLAARRDDPSDADWRIHIAARRRWQPIDPMLCRFGRVDASGSPGDMLEEGIRALEKAGLA
ncbi:MAG: AAA family ATPase, partial [Myxococcales bacterium]|nr:AAA family ATPase [Myxococcales bacterium]